MQGYQWNSKVFSARYWGSVSLTCDIVRRCRLGALAGMFLNAFSLYFPTFTVFHCYFESKKLDKFGVGNADDVEPRELTP